MYRLRKLEDFIYNKMLESKVLQLMSEKYKNSNETRKNFVIALIIQSTVEMHYINIIGYNDENYVILDTDGQVGYISKSRLRHWLDRDGYANFMLDNRHTLIKQIGHSEEAMRRKRESIRNEKEMKVVFRRIRREEKELKIKSDHGRGVTTACSGPYRGTFGPCVIL
ncbi:MAG: hypothetical protein GY830_09940 [Bacteroidetes bacterium]|nr:hypothetical protein [Bacteroidota bacterium]